MLGNRGSSIHDRKRVLVIDDDPDMGELVGLVLKHAGYEVDLAYDGRQGLQRFAETPPDVVVLDVMMPGMDGWAVLQHLREVSRVPVVVITATGTQANERMSQHLGAADFITKPFRPRDLTSRVARAAL
jgi:DNA-binding response OmpR family regulator